MTPKTHKTDVTTELTSAIANLRHLFSLMVEDYVNDTNQAARGLLGPAIEKLEHLQRDLPKLEEALAFYGDPGTYFSIGFIPTTHSGDFMRDFEDTVFGYKPGKMARRVLGNAQ